MNILKAVGGKRTTRSPYRTSCKLNYALIYLIPKKVHTRAAQTRIGEEAASRARERDCSATQENLDEGGGVDE